MGDYEGWWWNVQGLTFTECQPPDTDRESSRSVSKSVVNRTILESTLPPLKQTSWNRQSVRTWVLNCWCSLDLSWVEFYSSTMGLDNLRQSAAIVKQTNKTKQKSSMVCPLVCTSCSKDASFPAEAVFWEAGPGPPVRGWLERIFLFSCFVFFSSHIVTFILCSSHVLFGKTLFLTSSLRRLLSVFRTQPEPENLSSVASWQQDATVVTKEVVSGWLDISVDQDLFGTRFS